MKLDVLHRGEYAYIVEQDADDLELDIEAPPDDIEAQPEAKPEAQPEPAPAPAAPAPAAPEQSMPQTGYARPDGYSVRMARDQVDGILGKWMEVLGQFSPGDENRARLQQIGERLQEISNTMTRDFVEAGSEATSPI